MNGFGQAYEVVSSGILSSNIRLSWILIAGAVALLSFEHQVCEAINSMIYTLIFFSKYLRGVKCIQGGVKSLHSLTVLLVYLKDRREEEKFLYKCLKR